MHNDFIIIGTPSDPAGVRGMRDAVAALRRIEDKRAAFVSRGDNSGTHVKEQSLWNAGNLRPAGRW
jgi:tungstate transport system substrate-binding protein